MKKRKRLAALCLALILLLSVPALAATLGDPVGGWDTPITAETALARGVYWTGLDYQSENYLTLSPGGAVLPIVASGDPIRAAKSFSSLAAALQTQGVHVIGGINGDYFTVPNYEPVGILVEGGKVMSSDGGFNALGFQADGSAVMGQPGLTAALHTAYGDVSLLYLNKARPADDFALFTSDWGPDTGNTKPGREVVCDLVSGSLSMSGSLILSVREIDRNSGAAPIPAGAYVLSLADTADAWRQGFIDNLNAGDTITVTTACNDGWQDVIYAVGSLYKLVTGGAVNSGLDNSTEPRSAVGLKPDGALILYTVDGRQSGLSVGESMTQVAKRLIELGCTEATCMDGGGSTAMSAIYIGDSALSQINGPSDGYTRTVSNYIMLVTSARPTGVADRLAVYPLSVNLLKGVSVQFTAKASDSNGYAAPLPADAALTAPAELGAFGADGTFTAQCAGEGQVTATASNALSGTAALTVVETPDEIAVQDEASGKTVTALNLITGQSVNLMALAKSNHVALLSTDSCFTWAASADVGTIAPDGGFTAVSAQAVSQGAITVTAGDLTVSIPVTVSPPLRYSDVPADAWFYNAVEFVSDRGYFNGVGDGLFDPQGQMNRAMLVTVLYRAAGSPAVTGGNGFSDVPDGQWYSDPIAWASQDSIVNGVGGGLFDPNTSVTREQMTAVLYRYFGSPTGSPDITGFTDGDKIDGWALEAMRWAAAQGYITGQGGGILDPLGTATRAEVAAILSRCFA
ncbi:MAG: S-layer homology domain-containing protein [Firmicutes bacterium]|nr:S-layer homology domain-containing protein [Bacillota bacterium]